MIDAVAYLPLVKSIAWKYRDKGIALDELVGLGTEGLLEAIPHWNPTKGAFATIAKYYIKAKITDQFRKNTVYFNMYTEKNILDDLPIQTKTPSPEAIIMNKIDKEKVRKAIKLLTPSKQNIVLQRFYNEGDEPPTRQEIANSLGISHQRVGQLEESAIKDLRKILCL